MTSSAAGAIPVTPVVNTYQCLSSVVSLHMNY